MGMEVISSQGMGQVAVAIVSSGKIEWMYGEGERKVMRRTNRKAYLYSGIAE